MAATTEAAQETLSVTVKLYEPAGYDNDGAPTRRVLKYTEPAELLSHTPDRLTLRQAWPNNETSHYEWDAYRFNFTQLDEYGNVLGEQWAYGTSAELLRVEL